jgi:transcriptional regulator with XRE-family HTH domain
MSLGVRQTSLAGLAIGRGMRQRGDVMTSTLHRPLRAILVDCRFALHMSQREFGEALGASHRSASRWDAGRATPGAAQLTRLARRVYEVNRDLAVEVAEATRNTLVGLGIEAAPVPVPVVSHPVEPAPSPKERVDLVVLAVVERGALLPSVVRPLLRAAVRRARELGLTLDALEAGLRPVPKKSASRARA